MPQSTYIAKPEQDGENVAYGLPEEIAELSLRPPHSRQMDYERVAKQYGCRRCDMSMYDNKHPFSRVRSILYKYAA